MLFSERTTEKNSTHKIMNENINNDDWKKIVHGEVRDKFFPVISVRIVRAEWTVSLLALYLPAPIWSATRGPSSDRIRRFHPAAG